MAFCCYESRNVKKSSELIALVVWKLHQFGRFRQGHLTGPCHVRLKLPPKLLSAVTWRTSPGAKLSSCLDNGEESDEIDEIDEVSEVHR